MDHERYDKRIHVLIFESKSHNAMQEILRNVCRVLPGNVNILNYQVDDSSSELAWRAYGREPHYPILERIGEAGELFHRLSGRSAGRKGRKRLSCQGLSRSDAVDV